MRVAQPSPISLRPPSTERSSVALVKSSAALNPPVIQTLVHRAFRKRALSNTQSRKLAPLDLCFGEFGIGEIAYSGFGPDEQAPGQIGVLQTGIE